MSLLGIGIGMMFASFHMCGLMLLFSDILYMLVRYASTSSPICLRFLIMTLLCPVELLFWLCPIASWTCVVVSAIVVVCSLCVLLSYVSVCVACLTVLMNCLLMRLCG